MCLPENRQHNSDVTLYTESCVRLHTQYICVETTGRYMAVIALEFRMILGVIIRHLNRKTYYSFFSSDEIPRLIKGQKHEKVCDIQHIGLQAKQQPPEINCDTKLPMLPVVHVSKRN